MAFLMQYRRLQKQVKRQLDELNDGEKGHIAHNSQTQRLSGETSCDNKQIDNKGNSDATSGHASQHNKPHGDEVQENVDFEQYPYAALEGITLQTDKSGNKYYQVDFTSSNDPEIPRNWPTWIRFRSTCILILIAGVVTAASSVDSAIAVQAAKEFGVSEVVESLGGTAMFLLGLAIGSLLVAPASEMFGRFPVYLMTLFVFGIWIMASALSPNIGAQITFRFFAGMFGSAPLTVAGGSISDIWSPREKTWAFPFFAIVGFGGPSLGPIIASYIGVTHVLSWRWAEWVMLIFDGIVIFVTIVWKQETLAPQLLLYKARHFRKLTGNDTFKTAAEAENKSFAGVLKTNFSRPFILAMEWIVISFTFYLSVIYIVLFTFLDGYPYIFERTYGINQGLSNLAFIGLLVGILLSVVIIPIVYTITKHQLDRDGDDGQGSKLNQETRLIFSMIGAPLIPVGLLWMGWTDYVSISIWSPITASVVIGCGIVCIFTSAYMYIIDSYQIYAASALTFVALVRYLAAGGMTVVGVPMYQNLGTHWTLTVLGCISAIVVPIPYALYIWGSRIRATSKYAFGS